VYSPEQQRLSPTRIKTQLSVVSDNRSNLKKAVSVLTYCLFSGLNCALIPNLLEQINPTGASSGKSHVRRGGGWNNIVRRCRVVYRDNCPPTYADYSIGIRLVSSK